MKDIIIPILNVSTATIVNGQPSYMANEIQYYDSFSKLNFN